MTIVSRKRKQIADMADSPPKRVTRARAKATEDMQLGIRMTKITTASMKAAATTKTPVKPTKATKRRTRADDSAQNGATNEEQKLTQSTESELPKTRGRLKKTVDDEINQNLPAMDGPPRTRSHQDKLATNVEEEPGNITKPKGRPRKVAIEPVNKESKPRVVPTKPEPALKSTRGRATAPSSKPKAIAAALLKPPVSRKRVTFKDATEQDKENQPLLIKASSKPDLLSSGLKAKPVRKTASLKTVGRGKKVPQIDTVENDDGPKETVILPLSPKKATQLANVSSVSSEDELCGAKTPMKTLSRSPMKPPAIGEQESLSTKSNLESKDVMDLTSSPKASTPSILSSPARRPPSSPYKDTLKESPKKFKIKGEISQPALTKPQSPKKTSLFQSPARRPVSPIRLVGPGSVNKTEKRVLSFESTMTLQQPNTFSLFSSSTKSFASSPLRAANPSGHNIRAVKLAPPEQLSPVSHATDTISNGEEDPGTKLFRGLSGPGIETESLKLSGMGSGACRNVLQSSPSGAVSESDQQVMEAEDHTSRETRIEPSNESNADGKYPIMSGPKEGYILSSPTFSFALSDDSDSEDELQSHTHSKETSPLQGHGTSAVDCRESETPTRVRSSRTPRSTLRNRSSQRDTTASAVSMTPLAVQLSSWLASSPDKKQPKNTRNDSGGIFSPAGPTLFTIPNQSLTPIGAKSPLKSTFFEDEMAVRNDEIDVSETLLSDHVTDNVDTKASQESQESDQYGDENAEPTDPLLLEMEDVAQTVPETCTPARIFFSNPREVHTVSKVPLRPAGEESPVKASRKRSRSVTGPLSEVDEPSWPTFTRRNSATLCSLEAYLPSRGHQEQNKAMVEGTALKSDVFTEPSTPTPSTWSGVGTPSRAIRKGADAEILRGAVVFVDVHTTEGADASGIFIELLGQMGARCVKQWTWNPHAGSGIYGEKETLDQNQHNENSIPNNKVGITHVVFKDGGKRTLEKVRESKGLVLCVGVGWVLK